MINNNLGQIAFSILVISMTVTKGEKVSIAGKSLWFLRAFFVKYYNKIDIAVYFEL